MATQVRRHGRQDAVRGRLTDVEMRCSPSDSAHQRYDRKPADVRGKVDRLSRHPLEQAFHVSFALCEVAQLVLQQSPQYETSEVRHSGETGVAGGTSALEVAYQLYSFSDVKPQGKDELSFGNLMPSLMGYYVLRGDGYNFKFGGGVGVRFVSVDETRNINTAKINYTSTGYGFVARVEGNTLLGSSIYANIGADIRYDVNGEPENNGTPLHNNLQNENVNFNAFSIGVRLGITYIIGGNN
ncbi:MAG: hypothetical protein IH795_06245 [Bacteroidetes bacterium]|nr:hypothetical protein [Bacteroidota bacterium]